jgi:hypothetical protein
LLTGRPDLGARTLARRQLLGDDRSQSDKKRTEDGNPNLISAHRYRSVCQLQTGDANPISAISHQPSDSDLATTPTITRWPIARPTCERINMRSPYLPMLWISGPRTTRALLEIREHEQAISYMR